MFGLEKQDWELVQTLAITPLQTANYQLFIFGSRATGTHKKFSDLDILICGEPDEELAFHLAEIRETLEESLLPISVDLVVEKELAESYRDSVYATRQKLY